jgi:D-lactate dehydrogenase
VYEEEGPLFRFVQTIIQDDLRLTTLSNVAIAGHQGFLTREALTEIAEVTLSNIGAFQSGSPKREDLVRPLSQSMAGLA